MKKKLTEEQKMKAFKAFEESEIMKLPIGDRQASALFQVRLTTLIKDPDGAYEGAKNIVDAGIKVYEFTLEEMKKVAKGLSNLYAGVVNRIIELENEKGNNNETSTDDSNK